MNLPHNNLQLFPLEDSLLHFLPKKPHGAHWQRTTGGLQLSLKRAALSSAFKTSHGKNKKLTKLANIKRRLNYNILWNVLLIGKKWSNTLLIGWSTERQSNTMNTSCKIVCCSAAFCSSRCSWCGVLVALCSNQSICHQPSLLLLNSCYTHYTCSQPPESRACREGGGLC